MADVRDIRRIAFERFQIDIDLPESHGVYPATIWAEFTQHRKEPIQVGFTADDLELIAHHFQEMAKELREIDDEDFITETHPVPEQHPGMVSDE